MNSLVLWITGLPGSGKSTIAAGIKKHFPDFVVLRMDDLRTFVTPSPTYTEEEREFVYRAIVYTAKTLSGLGHNVVIDATGNLRRWRDLARAIIPNFVEVYLKCGVDACMKREGSRKDRHGAPPDIYKKGQAGWPVPGVNAPYEEPVSAELAVDTETVAPEEATGMVTAFLSDRFA